MAAERHEQLRADHLELGLEPREVVGDLVGPRVAIARRPGLDDVRDEDVAALEAGLGEQAVEEPAGAADERPPGRVLAGAGRLAHEHDVGGRAALAGDKVRRPLADLEGARDLADDLGPDRVEQLLRVAARAHAETSWPSSSRIRWAAVGASAPRLLLNIMRTVGTSSASFPARSPSSRSSSSSYRYAKRSATLRPRSQPSRLRP